MIDTKVHAGFRFLIDESQRSSVDLNMRSSKVGAAYRFFNKFTTARILVYITKSLFGILKGGHALVFNGCVVADHKSCVIARSIERSGISYVPVVKTVSRYAYLKAFSADLMGLVSIYRELESITDFDFYRTSGFFYSCTFWRAFFDSHEIKAVCLARTNNPHRVALGVVADKLSIDCYSWGVDRTSIRELAPFRINTYFCWSSVQAKNLNRSGIKSVVMRSDILPIRPFKVPSVKKAGVGLLLNAMVDLKMLLAYIEKLHVDFECSLICIRPHPGSALDSKDFPSYVIFCSWQEKLSQFLGQYDLMISMVSNAAIDALVHGVSVIYVPEGLDQLNYRSSHTLMNECIPVVSFEEDPVVFAFEYYSDKFEKYSEVVNSFSENFKDEVLNVKKIFN